MSKVREALGDSVTEPLFIETISRRGYRFKAPVTVVSKPAPDPFLETMNTAPWAENGTGASSLTVAPPPSTRPLLSLRNLVLVPGLAVILVGTVDIGR